MTLLKIINTDGIPNTLGELSQTNEHHGHHLFERIERKRILQITRPLLTLQGRKERANPCNGVGHGGTQNHS